LGYDLFVTIPDASPRARSRSSPSGGPVSSAYDTWEQSSSVAASIEASPPFRTVGFTLSSLGYAVSRRFRETLAPLHLEPREFALLRAVAAAEGQSQQALGERLLIPASRMVAFVDALQERGLLERRINPQDRRAHALHLTEAGRELLGRAVTAAIGLEREICAELDDGDRERLLDLMQRVGVRLGQPPDAHGAPVHSALADALP
jgi:DNA-binding MarR family transcriptional regulator